jgi:hypothetical protein
MKVSRHVHPSDDRAAVSNTKILGIHVRQDEGRGETGTPNPPHVNTRCTETYAPNAINI